MCPLIIFTGQHWCRFKLSLCRTPGQCGLFPSFSLLFFSCFFFFTWRFSLGTSTNICLWLQSLPCPPLIVFTTWNLFSYSYCHYHDAFHPVQHFNSTFVQGFYCVAKIFVERPNNSVLKCFILVLSVFCQQFLRVHVFCLACEVYWSRWWAMSRSQVSSVQFSAYWRRHLLDTSLHLPTSSISGRLNKPQLIGRWWQTSQAQFIGVWRQPIHFPSVARVSPNVEAMFSPTPKNILGAWCLHCVTDHRNNP